MSFRRLTEFVLRLAARKLLDSALESANRTAVGLRI